MESSCRQNRRTHATIANRASPESDGQLLLSRHKVFPPAVSLQTWVILDLVIHLEEAGPAHTSQQHLSIMQPDARCMPGACAMHAAAACMLLPPLHVPISISFLLTLIA